MSRLSGLPVRGDNVDWACRRSYKVLIMVADGMICTSTDYSRTLVWHAM